MLRDESLRTSVAILVQNINVIRGTETAVVNLANLLYRGGYNVKIISIFSRYEANIESLVDGILIEHLGLKIEANGSNFLRIIKLFRVASILRRKISRGSWIIASEDMLAISSLLSRFKFGRTKIIAWQHILYSGSPPIGKFLRRIMFKFVDNIVVLNHDDKIHYSNDGLKNISVIYNANTFRELVEADYSQLNCIAVGANTKVKSFDSLIILAAPILKSRPNWRITIIGRDVPDSNLATLAAEHSVINQIDLLHPSRDITGFYQKASFCLVTSLAESFSLVITEAKSHSICTLAFDCPSGPRELIHDGIDGFLISPGDDDSFRLRLSQLMDSFEMRREMGKNAAKSSETYSEERIYSDWMRILNS